MGHPKNFWGFFGAPQKFLGFFWGAPKIFGVFGAPQKFVPRDFWGTPKIFGAVSYTHLDVYKRQVYVYYVGPDVQTLKKAAREEALARLENWMIVPQNHLSTSVQVFFLPLDASYVIQTRKRVEKKKKEEIIT